MDGASSEEEGLRTYKSSEKRTLAGMMAIRVQYFPLHHVSLHAYKLDVEDKRGAARDVTRRLTSVPFLPWDKHLPAVSRAHVAQRGAQSLNECVHTKRLRTGAHTRVVEHRSGDKRSGVVHGDNAAGTCHDRAGAFSQDLIRTPPSSLRTPSPSAIRAMKLSFCRLYTSLRFIHILFSVRLSPQNHHPPDSPERI